MNFGVPPVRYDLHQSAMSERTTISASNIQIKEGGQTLMLQQYTANFKFIGLEGGRLLLRLRDFPRVQFDVASQTCHVAEWGVGFPVGEIAQIQRILARTFLTLLSKAEAETLDDPEAQQWETILRQVDYQAFSTDRSPSRYWEGVVVAKSPEVRVRWYFGEEQTVTTPVSSTLDLLNEGERFGAFIKRDHRRKVISIESLDILPASHGEFTWPGN